MVTKIHILCRYGLSKTVVQPNCWVYCLYFSLHIITFSIESQHICVNRERQSLGKMGANTYAEAVGKAGSVNMVTFQFHVGSRKPNLQLNIKIELITYSITD